MDQINNNPKTTCSKNELKSGGFLNEFLWICAGANRSVLRQCPTEYAKYAGIGGTILFTALMAMLSGGYAFYTIFEEVSTACFFGVFWGLLIFNLDRFMVNTMYSDGKHTISKDELLGGLPRIILAIFLGIIISVPIELRIFDDKIQSQLLIDRGKVGDDVRNANEELYNERNRIIELRGTYEDKLKELQTGTSDGYASRIATMERDLQVAEDKLYNETNGTGVTKKRGYGPAAKQLQEQVDRMRLALSSLREEERIAKSQNQEYINRQMISTQSYIDDLDRQLNNVNSQIIQKENERDKATNALTGFTARLKALSEITDYNNNTTLFIARLMIMLLFITIEIIPTLFKMMMTAGPYDNLLRAEMHRIKVLSDKRISDINDDINTEVYISVEKNKARIESELSANKMILEKLATTQASLLEEAIERWREEEYKKIQENPSAYIKMELDNNEENI
ncbi:MAG: DUF4407 domain-containing protein [Alphaproteobacteria bacterium]|nr:DUF4407 domain-containing protein [Alphaproteobacteria bacterium]